MDKEYYIKHLCNVGPGSYGSPILNLSTNKVIGIHKGSFTDINNNIGILLKYPLNEINNQIKLKLKINKKDINKEIYFLDNTKEHKYLNELTSSNTELYIDNKKYIYQKYFLPEKEGIYNIKLIFYINLIDCSFMFSGCYNIKKINLFSFITKNVVKMNNMFSGCKELEYLDLSSFNTKNVTDMSSMFNGCESLKRINISSFNTENVVNMNNMFYNCFSLEYLDLSSFDLKNIKFINNMLFGCINLINLKLCPYLDMNNSKDKSNILFGKKLIEFNIKFIGEEDYLIKRIKKINFIESNNYIKTFKNKLLLLKDKNEIIFNLINEKGYLNKTYHKPDCIIFVFNFENQKYYNYMKLCCKYYIKSYNLIYLFGINLNKNNINKFIENDAKQFADSNNLKFILINEDNENNIKNFLNNLLIKLERKENKEIINQGNINIMKEITPKIYKILLLGDSNIGAKTSLLLRLTDNSFNNYHYTTIGIDFKIKLINLKNGNKIKLQIWDTAGQERFRNIAKSYYKGAHIIVLGYDVTDRNSFEHISNWFDDKSRFRYLIGNKIDLCDERQVSEEEGRALANKLNLKFFEISCKDNIGIDEFYDDLMNDILNDF